MHHACAAADGSTNPLLLFPHFRHARACATPASTTMQHLVSGSRARIQGLVGAPQHNGKEGVLVAFIEETGRWSVKVGESELLAVKPANLLFLSKPQAPCIFYHRTSVGHTSEAVAIQRGKSSSCTSSFTNMWGEEFQLTVDAEVCACVCVSVFACLCVLVLAS